MLDRLRFVAIACSKDVRYQAQAVGRGLAGLLTAALWAEGPQGCVNSSPHTRPWTLIPLPTTHWAVSRGHSQMAVTPGAAFSLLFFNSGLLETEEWSAGSRRGAAPGAQSRGPTARCACPRLLLSWKFPGSCAALSCSFLFTVSQNISHVRRNCRTRAVAQGREALCTHHSDTTV